MTDTTRAVRALFLSGLLCFALLVSGVHLTGNAAGVGNTAVATAAGNAPISIAQTAVSQHADPTYNATYPSTDYQNAANTIRLNFHGTGANFDSDFPATVNSVSVDGSKYRTVSTSTAGNGEHIDIELQRDIPVPASGNVGISVDMRNVKNPPTVGNYGYTVDLRSSGTTEVRAGGYLDIVQGTTVTGQITDDTSGQLTTETANSGVVKFIDSAGQTEQRTVISQTGLNGAGNYGLTVPTNTDKIRVNADGYAPAVQTVSLSGASNTADISLNDGATIEGTVTDADGNGVGGITVFAEENQTGEIADRTTTAGNGAYSLSVNANLGKHAIVAGSQTQSREIGFKTNVNPSDNAKTVTVDLTTPKKASNEQLSVSVSGPSGNPVVGANVFVRRSDYQYGGQTLTNTTGVATFMKPPGEYTVRVETANYGAKITRGVTIQQGSSTDVAISLESSATIAGHVTGVNGGNAANIDILVSDGDQFYPTRTASDGTYTATVPAGAEYTVSVFAKGKSAAPQTVTPSESGVTGIDFTLEKSQIVSSGQPNSNTGAEISSGAGNDQKLGIGATLRSGLLRAKLYDTSKGNPGTGGGGAPADLSTLGATDQTEFKITLTVENFDPDALMWGIKDSSWEIQDNPADGYTDIVIEGKPTDIHATWTNGQGSQLPVGPVLKRNPAEISWPTGQDAGADVGVDTTVYFGLYELSAIPGPASSNLNGISTTTNAQAFAPPEYEDETLRVWVGAPSQRTDGQEHNGFYHADIPQSQLDAWGVTDPETELLVSYKSNQANYDVTDTADGARIEINNLGYSAFAVSIAPDDSVINDNDGGGGGDDDDEESDEPVDETVDTDDDGDGPAQIIDIGGQSDDEDDDSGFILITGDEADDGFEDANDSDEEFTDDARGDEEFADEDDDGPSEDEFEEEEEEFVRIAQTSVDSVSEGETVSITNLSSAIGDVPAAEESLAESDENATSVNGTATNTTELNDTTTATPQSETATPQTETATPEAETQQSQNTTSSGPDATINDMSITFENSQSNVTVEAGVNSTADEATGKPDQGEAIEYLQIDTSANNSDITEANFDISVSERERKQLGVSPDNVVVYRYHNETWQTLTTTHVNGNKYNVTTPGFSVFMVGTDIEYTNTEINVSQIRPGERFAGVATVSNNGVKNATANLTLGRGAQTISNTSITVPANTTKQVRMPATISAAGKYQITINGEDAGIIQVTTSETPTPETDTAAEMRAESTDTTATEMPTTGDGGPGFGFTAAVAAAMLVGVLARRRSA